jgi:hypothetical protein
MSGQYILCIEGNQAPINLKNLPTKENSMDKQDIYVVVTCAIAQVCLLVIVALWG